MPGPGSRPPAIGHVYGKLIDPEGKAISNASVYVMQSKYDSVSRKMRAILLKGTVTTANGEFSVDELPVFGKLTLTISAVGHQPYEKDISFMTRPPGNGAQRPNPGMAGMSGPPGNMANAFDKDLGNIKLAVGAKQLEAVTVTAGRSLIEMDLDKKTFHVDKNIVSAGGTAVDVMRNVPSVQVDIDGNVKMRNATPQIYIDGRPTTLTLDQIPADGIASVEVITNPSAKYDASGGNAGILNIVLKKNKRAGYNGNIMAGVDSRGGYNGGLNLNVRQGRFNFSASGMTNQIRNRLTGTTDRHHFSNTATTNIFQHNLNKTTGGFSFGKLGLDYFVTNRTTISLSGMKTYGKFKPRETIDSRTDSIVNTGMRSLFSNRISTAEREIDGTTGQLGIKHNFPRAGEEWTADITYSVRKVEGTGLNTTHYFDESGGTKGVLLQKNNMTADNKLLILQTDYVKPFSETSKLETGLRAQINPVSNTNENYIQYPGSPGFEKVAAAATNFKTNNNVYAAYVSFSGSIKKNFGYQLGLRAESSDFTGELRNTGEKFSKDYAASLFPSLFLSQKLKNDQQLQFSVTRRINRPTFYQLTPYMDFTDNLNITRGNPDLVPEFTHSAEFSYNKRFSANSTLLAAVYYKYTHDLITRYLEKGINPVTGEEAYINTFINARSGESYGAELTAVRTVGKWWDITANVNLYRSTIRTNDLPGEKDPSMWSVFTKLNNNFRLPKNFTVQLSADYQGKTNLPVNINQGFGPPMQAQSASQGYIRPFYTVDMAVKKTFLKDNAASVTLSVNDIFRSRKSDQHSEGIGFVQDYYRLNNPQIIRLNFSYRFGRTDLSLFKRKNMKSQGVGNMQDM